MYPQKDEIPRSKAERRMLPNFLVIGAAKCGTTQLCDLLARHPQVGICNPKEPRFFSKDRKFNQGLDWYESLFDHCQDCRAVGEGSTSYTRSMRYPESAPRIAEALPDAKLIYIVRNPLERLRSTFMQRRANGSLKCPTLQRMLEDDPSAIDDTRYLKQLAPYRERYPEDRFLYLFFEDLISDPNSLLKQCFRFLDVDPAVEIEIPERASNQSKDHLDRAWLGRLRSIPGCARLSIENMPAPIWKTLDAAFARPIGDKPVWTPDAIEFALDALADDTAKFLDLAGKPADIWNLEAAPRELAAAS